MSNGNEYLGWIMDLLAATGGLAIVVYFIYLWWIGRNLSK